MYVRSLKNDLQMDTVDYTGANVQLMKGIQHLPNWKLIIPLLLLTSYTACDISTPSSVPDSSDQIMTVTTCIGGTASFTWSYDVQPFFAIEWFFGDKLIADTTVKSFSKDDISIAPNYADRFHLQTAGNVEFNLTDVAKNDTGTYSCIVTLESTDIPKEFTTKLQAKEITLGDYIITVTSKTEDCRTLKCGEPVGTNTKYKWSIRANDTDVETHIRTTTNTFKFCLNPINCSVKCQRDYDCTETTWMCFKPGQSGRRRRKRRTLNEQLVPCDEDTDSGNQDDSSSNTTGIAVAVAIAVIAVIASIAILTVVIRRKLKSRAGRRSDSFEVETPANCACLELVVKTHQPEEKSDDELEELKDNKHL